MLAQFVYMILTCEPVTCRPAVGLNSLKPVKFLSPAPYEHSPSVMRYGLTNDTVFLVPLKLGLKNRSDLKHCVVG